MNHPFHLDGGQRIAGGFQLFYVDPLQISAAEARGEERGLQPLK